MMLHRQVMLGCCIMGQKAGGNYTVVRLMQKIPKKQLSSSIIIETYMTVAATCELCNRVAGSVPISSGCHQHLGLEDGTCG